MTPLIGFAGYATAGKNEAANALDRPQMAFADELKLDVAQLLAKQKITLPPKGVLRPLYVEYGRLCRAVEPAIWIRRLAASAKWSPNGVITDVRYKNEALWIMEKGGVVIYINRPGTGPANDEEAASIAELLWLNPTEIVNDGDVATLHARVLACVQGIGVGA